MTLQEIRLKDFLLENIENFQKEFANLDTKE